MTEPDILKMLPHKPPMVLLDNAVAKPDGVCRGWRQVRQGDSFVDSGGLAPAALIEMLCQTAACGAAAAAKAQGGQLEGRLVAVRNFRWNGRAAIGETVELFTEQTARYGSLATFKAQAEVGGQMLAAGELTLYSLPAQADGKEIRS